MQKKSEARFIASTDAGARVCAAAARISTQAGTALEIFENSQGGERDLKLVKKVLASGHKSILEHHVFSVAFENVSVLVEQFLIEFRLASFMVKSRRYVNFEGMGFYVPESLEGEACALYVANMGERFSDYAKLLELGIPKEDARFALPYCFLSNFYLTCNARELVSIICSMRYGRGSGFAELRALGGQLEAQFDEYYPSVVRSESADYERCAVEPLSERFEKPNLAESAAKLISCPQGGEALLQSALDFTGRFPGMALRQAVKQLVRDIRPRELECLSFTYLIENVSLPTVTHYARHRIQSPLFEHTLKSLNTGRYILPPTIAANDEATATYHRCFERNHQALLHTMDLGLDVHDASYFALSGGAVNLMITMNARELLHFLKLRTCARAQWEIQGLSLSLLDQLRAYAPSIFAHFGPSCWVMLRCPEGRMSCGKPQIPKDEGES